MEENKYGRLIRPIAEIEKKELEWWQKNALIEDKFCWVQPLVYQRILRGDYVNYVSKRLSKDSKILELGCGTGWLLFLLHEAGFSNLKGIDFSSEQIAIAQEKKSKLSFQKNKLLNFSVGGFELLEVLGEKYDAIICHGFLHHLSEEEIKTILNQSKNFLNKNGVLLIWEPFIYTKEWNQLSERFQAIIGLFVKGKKLGRKFSDLELEYRKLIKNRHEGIGLRGPSPKEVPFDKNEFYEYIHEGWNVSNERCFMLFSHLIGQELLLTALTYPNLIRVIERPILFIAKLWEKITIRIKKQDEIPFWIFELIECKPK